jgi:inorganic pyrophosphatase
MPDYSKIPPRNRETGAVHVIVETPKGHRNKLKYDEKLQIFKLSGVLPVGSSFPYDFGFIPSTRAEDGDPLDVLLLLDEPAPVGCLVEARLIGIIEAEQTEEGETFRNDRAIAVAENSKTYTDVRSLNDLNKHLIDEITHFFASYNEARGKKFDVLAIKGPQSAMKLLEKSRTAKPRKSER